MRIAITKPLFPWDCLENSPSLQTLRKFLEVLGQAPHLGLLHEVFDTMVRRLGEVVPDLGQDTAGDATALSGRRKGAAGAAAEEAAGLAQPSGGRKEYTDQAGTVYCYDRVSQPMLRNRMVFSAAWPPPEELIHPLYGSMDPWRAGGSRCHDDRDGSRRSRCLARCGRGSDATRRTATPVDQRERFLGHWRGARTSSVPWAIRSSATRRPTCCGAWGLPLSSSRSSRDRIRFALGR